MNFGQSWFRAAYYLRIDCSGNYPYWPFLSVLRSHNTFAGKL